MKTNSLTTTALCAAALFGVGAASAAGHGIRDAQDDLGRAGPAKASGTTP